MSRSRTAITLVALVVVLFLGLMIGWKAVSAPFPKLTESSKATCQKYKEKKRIYRKEITVSVYNASRRTGLADRTLAELERRSFRPGEVANAPSSITPRYARVLSTKKDDPEALLVARQFKPPAQVVQTENALGAGVDVVLGPRFKKLHKPGPKFLRLTDPIRTCVDEVDPDTGQ